MNVQVSVFQTSDNKENFLASYRSLMETWSIPYEDKWVDTSFGKTHVVVSGPLDGDPLVLVSGAQATNGMWGPMMPTLTKKHRVFCIGLIDQVGLSEPTKVLTTPQDSNTWLVETLSGLGLEKVSMVGNSMGSFIVSMFATAHSDRVKKVILTAPAATFSGVRFSYILSIIFASVVSSMSIKKRFLAKNGAGLVSESNSLFQVLLSAMNESKIISKIVPRQLTDDELSQFTFPTLVMLGGKDISAGKSANIVVETLSKLDLPFQFEVLPEAGHLWTEEQYMFAGNKIAQFLDNKVS